MNQFFKNKLFRIIVITIGYSIITTTVAYAQKKSYKVCLTYLPGFINSEDEGIGARLNKKILSRIEQREGVTFEVSFYPCKRALLLFNKGEADIVFATVLGDSGSDQTIFQNYDTIDSAPLAGSGYAIFTLKSFPKLSKLDDLRGKRVGIIRGVTLPEDFAKISTEVTEDFNSMEQNIFMLQKGRINAVLTLKSLGMEEIRRLNITNIHWGREFGFKFACYSVHLTGKELN
ncbi:MAG: transporter substrate-binding domain-containing protein [Desulfobacteraceae bacterium]|nr:transporter substrate-binding domain-containing protein [Desulfobacteraceae bacterium]